MCQVSWEQTVRLPCAPWGIAGQVKPSAAILHCKSLQKQEVANSFVMLSEVDTHSGFLSSITCR